MSRVQCIYTDSDILYSPTNIWSNVKLHLTQMLLVAINDSLLVSIVSDADVKISSLWAVMLAGLMFSGFWVVPENLNQFPVIWG